MKIFPRFGSFAEKPRVQNRIRRFPHTPTRPHPHTPILPFPLSPILLLLLLAPLCEAADATLGLCTETKQIWRGQVRSEDPVLVPALSLSAGALTIRANGVFDTDDGERRKNDFSRLEASASYLIPTDYVDIETGLLQHWFPRSDNKTTTELFAQARLTDFRVTPSLSVYYDTDEVGGWYVLLQILREIEITETVTCEFQLTHGWADDDYNESYFGVSDDGWNNRRIKISFRWDLSEESSITAFAAHDSVLDDDLRDAAADTYGDNETASAGMVYSYAF